MKLHLRTLLVFVLILVLLAACTPATPADVGQPAPSATPVQHKPTFEVVPAYPAAGELPVDGGGSLELLIEGAGLSMSKTDPGMALLVVEGNLPTPCDSLAYKVGLPDLNNQIKVSLAILPPAPGLNCIQTIQTVHKEIPLGKLPSGTYTVWINGQQAGSITMP